MATAGPGFKQQRFHARIRFDGIGKAMPHFMWLNIPTATL